MPPPKDPEKYKEYCEKQSQSMKNRYGDPEERKKTSKSTKKAKETIESKEKQSEAMKKYWTVEENRKRQSEVQKLSQIKPEVIKLKSESMKKIKGTPESKEKASILSTERWKDLEERKKNSETQKKIKGTHEYKERSSRKTKELWMDPTYHKNHCDAQKESYNNPKRKEKIIIRFCGQGFWYGNPTIGVDLDICEEIRHCDKMKDWKKKILMRDNYKDWFSGCGKSYNNPLNIHHIKPFIQIIEENNITSLLEAQNCKELWDINNGVTMLKSTHVAYHQMW